MLPFRATEALVPGQSVSIVLKEGRFYDLFQDCMDCHSSVLGMALMGEDSILDTLVLCEIADFSVDAGFRGKVTVAVTLRAVGRATVREITQMKPIMMGVCRELRDSSVDDDATSFVDDIRSTVAVLGRQTEWDQACRMARDWCTTTTSADVSPKDEQLGDVAAASWAALAVARDKTKIADAIALTNTTKRLQLALKVLLDETFDLNSGPSTTLQTDSETSGGFE